MIVPIVLRISPMDSPSSTASTMSPAMSLTLFIASPTVGKKITPAVGIQLGKDIPGM